MIPGSKKSEKPNDITGIDEIHLKCDCIGGIIVNGERQPISTSFALDEPPGHEIFEEPRMKLFLKINKSVLSPITIHLEDDDYKSVDFNNEKIGFACQLIKV